MCFIQEDSIELILVVFNFFFPFLMMSSLRRNKLSEVCINTSKISKSDVWFQNTIQYSNLKTSLGFVNFSLHIFKN